MDNKNEFFVPINEVSKELDVPAHTLRYWEKQFASAIRPVTGAGNRRYYRRETIEKIKSIKSLLYDKGMTIAGVKKALHNGTLENEISNTVQDKAPMELPLQSEARTNVAEIDKAIDLLNRAKSMLE